MAKEKRFITVDGVKYPYMELCGAIIDLKEEFGKEVGDIAGSVSGTVEYAYCCVRATCRKQGVCFPFADFKAFADSLEVDDLNSIGPDEEKAEGDSGKK